MSASYRIGVDVGGTFTDFIVLDGASGAVGFHKVPSTPHDPSEAIEKGLRQILAQAGIAPEQVGFLAHGTTVATNIVIERRGARVGLLTTRGFRDVLEIGRQARPSIYDYRVQKPPVLVPRNRRMEVTERIGPAGDVLIPLDHASLADAVAGLAAQGVDSVAICFLHSYRAPAHEKAARAVVERGLPHAFISVSSEILPEFREFERMSTTVVNAFVGPRMGAYLDRFQSRVAGLGIRATPYTIQSNGGLLSLDAVRGRPVRTCVSGPAAGVVGAAEIGRAAGLQNLITFDVGGTSTDVSLVHGGRLMFTGARSVAGYPVRTPMVDIMVIGAGGGSIAAIDDAGALKVGPRSAGAHPGPAAYGLGGEEPTLTDANLCLGRLDPERFLGGRMQVDPAAARRVVAARIAGPLGLSVEAAAHGMVRVANAAMSRAIRSISVERGHALSDFALCAFGGAGPIHAAEVAQECGIPQVLLPREPGTLCARGILLSDLSTDAVRSCFGPATDPGWAAILAHFAAMEQEGEVWLDREAVPAAGRLHRRVLDARYRGQNFEVKVDCDGADNAGQVIRRFHEAHAQEYGYAIPGRAIEFVSCRVQSIGRVAKAPQAEWDVTGSLAQAVSGARQVYIDAASGWQQATVYERERLPRGASFTGPAIVNEMSATTLLLPGQRAVVDRFGNLILGDAP